MHSPGLLPNSQTARSEAHRAAGLIGFPAVGSRGGKGAEKKQSSICLCSTASRSRDGGGSCSFCCGPLSLLPLQQGYFLNALLQKPTLHSRVYPSGSAVIHGPLCYQGVTAFRRSLYARQAKHRELVRGSRAGMVLRSNLRGHSGEFRVPGTSYSTFCLSKGLWCQRGGLTRSALALAGHQTLPPAS